nr:phosphoribosylformylglycinamidine synthase [Treponemataceae bacterium]
IYESVETGADDVVILWEYLPGQYDQRADSAEQCLSLLRAGMASSASVGMEPPRVRCAKMVVLSGTVGADDVRRIEAYLINPVDSRLADSRKPETLELSAEEPAGIPSVAGFIGWDAAALEQYRAQMGLAMDCADIRFLQDYFKKEGRDPTVTEIRVLDTYWSDHCRHTTFLTELKSIQIADGPYKALFQKSLDSYTEMRAELYAGRDGRPVTLMDMAVIGMKYLKKHGRLDDLEVSEENNACSVYVDVHYTRGKDGAPLKEGDAGSVERWLLMFKNETHNHPTEIEPFGGAATCIGGAIRDPLSGRSWVYQSMRVTGAADPTVPLSATRAGKLPQLKLVRESAQGFSSYGNQIGLTTGQVVELYHPGYLAKRMELGAVIAAAPEAMVVRERPEPGDVVILLGGGTGRDGIGGATGSSKVHTEQSVATAAAEVQKGNAVEERKIQRLFRNEEVSLMIRRCNDFGAGGVSVAVGELAPGLDINLDAVPKKYEGLDGTELAISESQERMAVVVRASDAERFIAAAAQENLAAVKVADVTDTDRLVMRWRGSVIVDIAREFVDAAGAHHEASALIESPAAPQDSPLVNPLDSVRAALGARAVRGGAAPSADGLKAAWLADIGDLACCSQRGLGERFDGSIGAASVLFPYGGKYQCTPEAGMAAKLPVVAPQETSTASLMAFGFDPRVGEWSPWHGAQTAVLSSLAKIACMGGRPADCRLSFQEFFGRAVDGPSWGHPAAALLGALDAQKAMGTASIGGKDSMSGSFEELNVPHTLVSFAVSHLEARNVVSGAFKKAGDRVYLVSVPYSAELAPDFAAFAKNTDELCRLSGAGKIAAMYPVCAGGIAEALTKMALGNRIGADITAVPRSCTAAGIAPEGAACAADLFTPLYGAIVVEAEEELAASAFAPGTLSEVGRTSAAPEIRLDVPGIGGMALPLSEAEAAWERTLSKVFPPVSGAAVQKELPVFARAVHKSLGDVRRNPSFQLVRPKTKPRVLLPVFPGTNCEYDMARAFQLAGAETELLVFANNTPQALERSLSELERRLAGAQILALSGGFSAGDEPDGSGKFIANVLREPRIAAQVMDLLQKRDGLVLGICNGFQALIKTGLVISGEICAPAEEMPTLTFNTVGRHISRIARTRIVSAASPWAMDPSVIDSRIHLVPISHGEGRIVMDERTAEALFARGQIFSQYVDEHGIPAVAEPDNPNGSLFAIEGITSPDGRILGKMGHSERTIGTEAGGASYDLIRNVAGNPLENPQENSCQNIFAAGVRYFY